MFCDKLRDLDLAEYYVKSFILPITARWINLLFAIYNFKIYFMLGNVNIQLCCVHQMLCALSIIPWLCTRVLPSVIYYCLNCKFVVRKISSFSILLFAEIWNSVLSSWLFEAQKYNCAEWFDIQFKVEIILTKYYRKR